MKVIKYGPGLEYLEESLPIFPRSRKCNSCGTRAIVQDASEVFRASYQTSTPSTEWQCPACGLKSIFTTTLPEFNQIKEMWDAREKENTSWKSFVFSPEMGLIAIPLVPLIAAAAFGVESDHQEFFITLFFTFVLNFVFVMRTLLK